MVQVKVTWVVLYTTLLPPKSVKRPGICGNVPFEIRPLPFKVETTANSPLAQGVAQCDTVYVTLVIPVGTSDGDIIVN